MMAELALVREAGLYGNFPQREIASLEELLGPFDSSGENILVRRQACRRLELPGEVVRANVRNGGQLLQGQPGIELLLDIGDHRA